MKKYFLFLSAILFLFSCKKDDDNCTTNAASIAGSYKVTAMKYKASATAPEEDYINIVLDPCEQDDIYVFNSNGTYQVQDAGQTCSPSSSDNGTWSVNGNTMVIDGDAASIQSFDCKTLVIVNTDTQTSGDQFKVVLTRQ